MEFIDGKTIQLDKIENELDRLVLDFIGILKKHTKYVIVSGYVSILFGRARATEDIDVYIGKIGKEALKSLNDELMKNSYYCLNSADVGDMHEHLSETLALRFAKKNTIIPNFEIKFIKNEMDKDTLENPLRVIIPSGELLVSSIERQIAFKRYFLKSEKDMEDARHLEKVFEGSINDKLIARYKLLIEGLS